MQLRIECTAGRVRERRGNQIACVAILLATLLADSGCGEGFEFTERNSRRRLVRRHHSIIIQGHRQHGNRFRGGTGEVVEHPPFVLLLLSQRQPFMILRIPILAKRVKLLAGYIQLQLQSFHAHADPLAGTDFACRVVIVLLQMLVEILLGIGQVFLCDSGKHAVRGYPVFRTLQRA